ncbi:MAG TPA: CDC48 family AAA ATPase [Methanomicrobiales archaeon]|nr:CDC48 family AAA ATPase [Methanomicrobiales archaeon]
MTSKDSAEVTVKEAYLGDPGRGIARISLDVMKALSLVSGDVIEIEGRKKATAVVWPGYPEDTRKAVLRIDGTIRANAGTGIDEKVRIRKIEVVYAKKVVVQMTQPVRLGGYGEQYLSRLLRGRAVEEGMGFRVDLLGTSYTFVVTKVIPKGVGVVTDDTEIELKEEAYEPEKETKGKKEVSDVHYEDIGGLGRELQLVREMIELPLRHPELFERIGIEPPKGVLLYGPPGTGKTLIAKAVANEVDAHFITLSGPEIMSKFYGESEKHLREVFEEAEQNAPAIIFIDELDSIAPKRAEVTGEVERRVVAQLLALMDGLKGRGQVVVIAATNLPDSIDPALRRGGRFDREIEVGIPDKKGRMEIFQIHTRGVPLDLEKEELTEEQRRKVEEDFNAKKLDLDYYREKLVTEKKREKFDRQARPGASFDPAKVTLTGEEMKAVDADYTQRFEEEKRKIEEPYRKENFLREYADSTHGFVGADIALLVKEAAMFALRCVIPRIKIDEAIPAEILDKLRVRKADFEEARKHVEPSAMREVLVEIPDVEWTDVGGLEEVKQELREAVEWPLKYGEVYSALQTKPPKGILLFGPPGTGKTLLAKAVANESECNFISVKGPELLSKWVGESEKGVREIFRKARQASPSIIFFDEVDALVPRRGMYMGSSHVTESVVSQILTELDGLEELKNVVVLGATNRPDMIDPALLRPGRLDRVIYVPPPDRESRLKILEVYLGGAKAILSPDISLEGLVDRTDGYVGADIEALVREAKLAAMREVVSGFAGKTEAERKEAVARVQITGEHFDQAFARVKGSLDADTLEENERRSWEMIFRAEERKSLDFALGVLKKAQLAGGAEPPEDLAKAMGDLRAAIFARRKDWKELKKSRERLEKLLEKRQKVPDKVPLTAR